MSNNAQRLQMAAEQRLMRINDLKDRVAAMRDRIDAIDWKPNRSDGDSSTPAM